MKNDNQTMDRQIPVSEQRKRKMKKAALWAGGFLAVLGIAAWLGTQMIPTLDKKALVISDVDRGTIDVSVSATGKVVPAFEEIIVSPISSRILEVYAHSGDSVDVGTPLLRLDLQSAETDYAKALDEREIKRQQMAQLKANTETQLSDRKMQIEVEEMKVSQLEAQLRNELYLDSLGSGTRDRVRQAETALRTAQLQLSQLRQQYANEKKVKQADLRMQQLQDGIFEKGMTETLTAAKDIKAEAGEFVLFGSGWGVLEEHKRAAEGGLTLSDSITLPEGALTDAQKEWLVLLNEGFLPEKDVKCEPAGYLVDEFWREKLRESLKKPENRNWYALMQMAVIEYAAGNTETALELFKESVSVCEKGCNLCSLYEVQYWLSTIVKPFYILSFWFRQADFDAGYSVVGAIFSFY